EVGGVPVSHLTADFDVARAFADFQQAAARSGQAGQIPASAQQTLSDAVKGATVDVFTGESDHVLRRLAVAGQFEGKGPTGAGTPKGTVTFDLLISDVKRPQEIRAPRNAAPISRPRGALGASGVTLGGTGATKAPAPARKREQSHRKSGAGAARRRSGSAYVACVQGAQDLAALQKCQALLP